MIIKELHYSSIVVICEDSGEVKSLKLLSAAAYVKRVISGQEVFLSVQVIILFL